MSGHARIADHVQRNFEAGQVGGLIRKIRRHDFTWKGYSRHCSEDDPQYEIESDKTDHVAMHKGAALTRFWDVDGVDLKPDSGPVDPIDLTAMNQPDQDP